MYRSRAPSERGESPIETPDWDMNPTTLNFYPTAVFTIAHFNKQKPGRLAYLLTRGSEFGSKDSNAHLLPDSIHAEPCLSDFNQQLEIGKHAWVLSETSKAHESLECQPIGNAARASIHRFWFDLQDSLQSPAIRNFLQHHAFEYHSRRLRNEMISLPRGAKRSDSCHRVDDQKLEA